jgi:septum formation protein
MNELGIDYKVVEPQSNEDSSALDPRRRVVDNAESKAMSLAGCFSDALIVTADTVMFLDGVFLGKPVDEEDAIRMLGMLSGRVHQVYSGVAVYDTREDKMVSGFEVTSVSFKKLSHEEILGYVESGEPLDKAGAYGIQGLGGSLVERIDGSWDNVVGLPLGLLRCLLANFLDLSL